MGYHPAAAGQLGAAPDRGAGAKRGVDYLSAGRPPIAATEAVALAQAPGVELGLHRVRIRLAAPTASGGANPQIQ